MTLTITLVKEPAEGALPVEAVRVEALDDHPQRALLTAAGFEAKAGQTQYVSVDERGAGLVVGLGADDDRTLDTLRTAGASIARAAAKQDAIAVTGLLEAGGDNSAAKVAQAVAEGLRLGHYRYTDLKSEPEEPSLTSVEIVGTGGKRVQEALDLGAAVAEAACVTRDLVNEPGGSLTPTAMAKKVEKLGERFGFAVEVLGAKEIRAAKMGGMLGVNRGSEQAPRYLRLTWTPESAPRGTVALVGKGVTFDSGGLSLKPSEGMLWMKGDMAGAGAVVGAFCGLGAVKPRVEVRGYVPLTDNMTGGDATRVGDVLTISNGKTVEVHNTDAEGRLILADALSDASSAGPDAIVDLATLTGACMVALGPSHAGVMGTNESLVEQVLGAAEASGEKAWPLPLPDEWRKNLDSEVADMKNIGGRFGGASIAGLFLREFVGEGIPWAHIDIAGPAFTDQGSEIEAKGGTGYGVRTLLELLKSYKKPR